MQQNNVIIINRAWTGMTNLYLLPDEYLFLVSWNKTTRYVYLEAKATSLLC